MAGEEGASAPSAWKWFAVTFSAVALIMSFLAVGITTFSDDNGSGGGGSGDVAAGSGGTIELSEFKISGDLMVPQGSSVTVKNTGTTAHNLVVTDGPKISDIQPGEAANLDLSSLDPGEYEVTCTIAGHADSGMKATLMIHEGGSTTGSASAGASSGDAFTAAEYQKMSDAMTASIKAFPAKTKGLGNPPLAPKVAADGTKVFDLTAKIVKWEVAPGETVDAWTYNGTVPGPVMHVDPGDHVRINLHNELPQGTDMHIHGISLPNDMDGVAPLTQPLIEPGKTFTYDFVAEGPALGMYHAHHMGNHQVPNGLLGVFEIGDMPMPAGGTIGGRTVPAGIQVAKKVQMVLNDAGTIGLTLNGKSFPATEPYTSKVGDWVQINYFNEGFQIHPMHPHQFPQLVIAKDGIPLDNPYWADTLNVAPGERYTVLLNTNKAGAWVWHCHILNHVESDTGVFGMLTAWIVE